MVKHDPALFKKGAILVKSPIISEAVLKKECFQLLRRNIDLGINTLTFRRENFLQSYYLDVRSLDKIKRIVFPHDDLSKMTSLLLGDSQTFLESKSNGRSALLILEKLESLIKIILNDKNFKKMSSFQTPLEMAFDPIEVRATSTYSVSLEFEGKTLLTFFVFEI